MHYKITVVSPDGEEKEVGNVDFILKNYLREGWLPKVENAPAAEAPQVPAGGARKGRPRKAATPKE